MCNIQLQDLDLEQNRIWIVGKGGKVESQEVV